MLNKNNYGEELRSKFSIRKLSIGATAVLLGFTFWTTSQTAKADTIVPDYKTENSANGGGIKTGQNKLSTYSELSSFLKGQDNAQTPVKPAKASAEKPVANNSSNIAAEKPISANGGSAAAEGKDKPESDPSQNDPSHPAIDPNLPTLYKGKWNNIDASYNTRTNELTLLGGTDAAPAIMKPAEGEDMLQSLSSFLGLLVGYYESAETLTIKGKIKVYGNANRLFADIIELRKIDGLENLDTSEVTNMGFMFADLPWVTKLDVSHFNTSKVTFMVGMFSGCRSLLSLDMSHFDTSKVMFMADMFAGCDSLTSLDLSSFNTASLQVDGDDTTLAMDNMFLCSNLQILTLGKKFQFNGTLGFENLPGKWINWGMANKKLRKGNNQWSSAELSGKYNGFMDYDTYVRFTNLAAPITIKYRDLQGKKFADIDDDIEFGNVGDSLINAKNPDSILSFKYKNIPGYGFDHAQVDKEKIDLKNIKYTDTPQTITLFNSEYPSTGKETIKKAKVNPVTLKLKHNAYIYDSNGNRANGIILSERSIITTYGDKTINGRKFYILIDKGNDNKKYYVAAGNVNPVSQKLKHNAYVYNKYGKRIKNAGILKAGISINRFGYAVKINGHYYFNIDNGQFVRVANVALESGTKAVAKAAIKPNNTDMTIMHNAYLYDNQGKRINGIIILAGSTINNLTLSNINNKPYYKLENGMYIAAGNIDASKLKLKHNAYIYNKYGNRLGKKVLKKGKSIKAYGDSVTIKQKKYYITAKNKFVKKSNFR